MENKKLQKWVFKGDPSLSPLAASKEIHEIETWISESTKALLDQEIEHCRLYRKPNLPEEILVEALELFDIASYTSPNVKGPEEEKDCSITFRLKPHEAQLLWNIECWIVGSGEKTSIASIINFALRIYISGS
jgi:hypothetical protein